MRIPPSFSLWLAIVLSYALPGLADAKDIHSYAQPALARVTHVDLDLTADFEARVLSGTATLDIVATRSARELVLDTHGLTIHSVRDSSGPHLSWTIGTPDPILGAPLTITLGKSHRVVIRYTTQPDAPALQWLLPEQTAGRSQPFLYSQGQSIFTRSWIPTQDSPGIRQTWSARIVAPARLRTVMSAEALTPDGESIGAGSRAWQFQMSQPVPPYLIAIAIGDLAFEPLGPRTGVYSEPATLRAAVAQLADMERMINLAESLCGPYRFGRFDVLIMPPSFHLGGMENTRLSFITPGVLTGDASQMYIVVHEFAHAWASALVSNATWADLWLNEAFTAYFEDRILEQWYGTEFAIAQSDLHWSELTGALPMLGGASSPNTRLYLDLAGRHPDEAMNPVATTKGAALLRALERAVGRARFDAYVRSYFDRFAFQPQTTQRFVQDARKHLLRGDAQLEREIDLDRWIYGVGLPDDALRPRSKLLAAAEARARSFAESNADPTLDESEFASWSSFERVRFINSLPRQLTSEQLSALDRIVRESKTRVGGTRQAWLRLAIANRYEPALAALEEHLTQSGNRAAVTALFRDLLGQGLWGRNIAERLYVKVRPGYHSATQSAVDKLLAIR